MQRFHVVSVIVALLLMILVSACGSEPAPEVEDAQQGAAAEAATESEATAAEAVAEDEATAAEAAAESESPVAELRDLDPNNFDDSSTNIDNKWFPLQPGTQWVYEGITVEDGEEIPHRVVFVVTDLTKVIEGVPTVVVWDQDYADGELVETEIAFFAQDKEGHVWHFGQYPEEYEDGKFVDAPTWITGLAGAKAGISMKAEPQLGAPSYFQGWGPAVDWTDYAQVDQMDQETCVPVDCYEDVLVIAETSLDEPGAFQLKSYAPGVGNVRVGWRGDDTTQEELELVDYGQLDPEALAEARTAALELEKHAYEISPGVYAHTTPMEHTLVAEVPVTTVSETSSEEAMEATIDSEAIEKVFEDFDPNNFESSTNIDNEWLPLKPGMQWVYEGITVEDDEEIPHRVVFTVTDLTKVIDGVRAVVAWDQDYSDDELVETELAFFAQDKDGNVWHLGQYPEEYEDGELVDAPAWIHGLEDARAGISMKANPQLGTSSYFQGWAPAVDWTDYGQVDQIGQETCVPADCYEDVLVIAETSLDEPGAFQLKYYARGVGNVQVGWRGEDASQEELELVEFMQLDPEALAEVRAAALELEERAYEVSPDVYGQTPPVEGP